MSERKLVEEQQRGHEAQRILDHELVKQALDDIEAATVRKWEVAGGEKEREDLWRLYKVAKLFRDVLRSHIETGKMAEFTLQQSLLEKAKQRVFG